jgi:hypothetical protein
MQFSAHRKGVAGRTQMFAFCILEGHPCRFPHDGGVQKNATSTKNLNILARAISASSRRGGSSLLYGAQAQLA